MQCTVNGCQQPAIITKPLPLCELDGVAVLASFIAKGSEVSKPVEPDPLIAIIRRDFAALISNGGLPSLRQLRQTYQIGQGRALRIHRHLSQEMKTGAGESHAG